MHPLPIPQVLAILTLSLVAGFSVNAHFRCKENYDDVITFRFKYPFSTYTTINGSTQVTTNTERYQYHQANSGAVLLVTWGVFTMFYCVIAVMVYVVFTANERLERVVDCLVYLVRSIHTSCLFFLLFLATPYHFPVSHTGSGKGYISP